MQIHVTEDDIQSSFTNAFNNPFSRALQRETGKQWLLFGGSTAIQVDNLQCIVFLPEDVSDNWLYFKAGGILEPFEFEFEFDGASADHNGEALDPFEFEFATASADHNGGNFAGTLQGAMS